MSETNSEQAPLTKTQQHAALEFERFISNLIRERRPARRSVWLKVLDSAGAVALITVVIGGAFTTLITERFNRAAKERDFQNEIIKIYSQRKLEEQFRERAAALNESTTLVGSSIERADSLIAIDGDAYARRMNPHDQAINADQIGRIKRTFNDQQKAWYAQRGALRVRLQSQLGLRLGDAWAQVARHVDIYMDCAVRHVVHPPPAVGLACSSEKASAEAALDDFFKILTEEMRQSWINQEDVAQIRRALEYPEKHDQEPSAKTPTVASQAPAPPQPTRPPPAVSGKTSAHSVYK